MKMMKKESSTAVCLQITGRVLPKMPRTDMERIKTAIAIPAQNWMKTSYLEIMKEAKPGERASSFITTYVLIGGADDPGNQQFIIILTVWQFSLLWNGSCYLAFPNGSFEEKLKFFFAWSVRFSFEARINRDRKKHSGEIINKKPKR
jgi:hypothetical protein